MQLIGRIIAVIIGHWILVALFGGLAITIAMGIMLGFAGLMAFGALANVAETKPVPVKERLVQVKPNQWKVTK